ncbi:hypothetical protein D3C81_1892090 [compost metagenome]
MIKRRSFVTSGQANKLPELIPVSRRQLIRLLAEFRIVLVADSGAFHEHAEPRPILSVFREPPLLPP